MNEGVILMTVGMVVVFAALTLLLGAIALLFRVVAKKKPAAEAKSETVDREEPSLPEEQKIDGQLIAILTAAASAALGARVRVHRVGFIEEQWLADHGWVQQARAEHHASHRIKSH